MKFNDVSKDAQVILMGGALAGVVEVFGRDDEDEGKQLIETALRQVGLTFDEFRTMMTEMPPEVEAEVASVQTVAADPDDDFDDQQLDTMEERPGNLDEDGRTDENGWQTLEDEQ
ncbi:hypothetical protein MPK71_gp316 [Erwinia phage pEa_SNUABM_1]|uniref:Uncharacterized protein n=1 Tax=Erwinia phage pEa_SNUABM_1 TaxID=2869543 RepID=A0AAE7XL36_9CAUD|nr:hypothetical protein MPK71_gp316 [Erwinia phage pEa_SNUABM_1]QZE57525.1 hypothetical protein pEaSNUABM1_00316 [Erwinia phage pEa_SNUABM_1]